MSDNEAEQQLAAEREDIWKLRDEIARLHGELAAAVEALKRIAEDNMGGHEAADVADAALAKLGEGK